MVVVRERRGKSEKRSKESTRGGGGSSPSPSQLPSLPSPPPCVDVLFQAASHTEVRECVHKTLAKAPSRALRGAAAAPGRAKRVGRRRWNRSGKQASGRRRHQMNALVKPRVEDSTGDSLRASRSSSIARRLHQRLGTVEAKRHHKGGAKQGTAAWKKSGDGQCCSHSPAEKRPDRRLFPLRRGFAHHKVRVQDAKLDRLDALDGRRRVREAVQRRHRKKRSGLPSTLSFRCFPGCSLALSALAALSRATQGFSHVRARVHAQGPRCRRDEEEGRARESEMPCFFCLFFCCLSLSLSSRRWAAEVNRGLLSGIAIGTDGATQKKTSAVKKHEGSAFSSSPRRCKRDLRVPFSSQGPLLYRLPALPKRDGGGESIFVEKFARKRRPSIVFFLLCRRSLLLSLLDLLLRAEENTRPCSAF